MGGVLAYDVCNMDSFKHIPVWLQEARRHIEPHQASFILVGCKADLAVGNNREVTSQQGQVGHRAPEKKIHKIIDPVKTANSHSYTFTL